VKQESVFFIIEGKCAGPKVCPLSRVKPGTTVAIKQLSTGPELTDRLRELGFCEQQQITLVSSDPNYICQVCNARLGISQKLADAILVESLPNGHESELPAASPASKAAPRKVRR
jgi:Fe2+ transport system protein FeoA